MGAKHDLLTVLADTLFDGNKISESVDGNIVCVLRHKLGDNSRRVVFAAGNSLSSGNFLKYIKHFLFLH